MLRTVVDVSSHAEGPAASFTPSVRDIGLARTRNTLLKRKRPRYDLDCFTNLRLTQHRIITFSHPSCLSCGYRQSTPSSLSVHIRLRTHFNRLIAPSHIILKRIIASHRIASHFERHSSHINQAIHQAFPHRISHARVLHVFRVSQPYMSSPPLVTGIVGRVERGTKRETG